MIRVDLAGRQKQSWDGLCDVADIYPRGWAVVGGQLTFLHLVDRGFGNPRPTADLDAAIDVRGHHPDAVQRFVDAMRRVGFKPAGVSPNGHHHRWLREGAQIDILIPSGLHPERSDGNRQEVGRVTTIESRGLQFAINRTIQVEMVINGRTANINIPDLIGALYGKCSALMNHLDRNVERHLTDIVLLASVAERRDRTELSSLSRRELRRLHAGLLRAVTDTRTRYSTAASAYAKAADLLLTLEYLAEA